MSSVFISCSTDPSAQREQYIASQLQAELAARGITSCCYTSSPATAQAQNDFFTNAADAAVLVAVGVRAELLASGWAQAGWNSFNTAAASGKKPFFKKFALLENMSYEALPAQLSDCRVCTSIYETVNEIALAVAPQPAAAPVQNQPAYIPTESKAAGQTYAPVPQAAAPVMTAPAKKTSAGTVIGVILAIAVAVTAGVIFLMNFDFGSKYDYVIYEYEDEDGYVYYDAYFADGTYRGTWWSWDDVDNLEFLIESIENDDLEEISQGEFKYKKADRKIMLDYTAPESDDSIVCEFEGELSAGMTRISGEYYSDYSLNDANYKAEFVGYVYDGELIEESDVLEDFWAAAAK